MEGFRVIPPRLPTASSCLPEVSTRLLRLLALCGVVTVLVAGCATPVYEGSLPWADGWRVGKVSRIEATAQDLTFYKRRCMPKQLGHSSERFAIVQWVEVGRSRWTVARLPADVTVVVGESVYVKVWDCSAALVKREKS